MNAAGWALDLVLFLFILLLLARLVVDWMQNFAHSWVPRGPMLVVLEIVYSTTDPPIRAVRRILPPLRIGGIAIDTSFFVVLLIAYVLRLLVDSLLLS